MSETNYYVKNSADGTEVAVAMGMYVNSFTYPTKKFYECMQSLAKRANKHYRYLPMV